MDRLRRGPRHRRPSITAYFLIFLFPEVANHLNLIIYCNIVVVLTVAYAYLRHRDSVTDDEYFEMIRPVLRLSLILVYFLAGFHKLNEDYFNPEVSCAAEMFRMLVSLMQKSILGVPVGLVLSAMGLFILYRLIRGGRFGAPGERVFTLLVVLFVGGVLCGVLIVLLEAQFDNAAALRSIGLATGVLIVLWELIGSLMLAVPRYQAVMVPFSLATATCGDLRAHAGRIAEENRLRSPVVSSMRLSLTRGARTPTAPAAVTTSRGW